ncbi:MAG: hypothetical protein EBT66_05560 [Bacteroidetes bacterium]|nr:hypothetical protein [Bacteroidota bacterium]
MDFIASNINDSTSYSNFNNNFLIIFHICLALGKQKFNKKGLEAPNDTRFYQNHTNKNPSLS